jgi:hypothetical protein
MTKEAKNVVSYVEDYIQELENEIERLTDLLAKYEAE